MKARITERTRVIFIANPNNPTGTWLRAAELEAFIKEVPEHALVVVDEAYFDYAIEPSTGAEAYPDTSTWVARYPNLMVARTFSKSYGLAGLRVGYAISHPQVADLMNRVRPPFNVNSVALSAAAAALDDNEHLQRSVKMNADGLRQLETGFKEQGLNYIPSVGNFISVDVGRPAGPVYEALLREAVIVRPVANYGMPNHLRVTVGTGEENERFLTALQKVLAD
jgi:histidinol-phosphate aminotransferase